MRENLQNLDAVKELIKAQLPRYLASRGRLTDARKPFSCINPEHHDAHPSCGLVRASNDTIFHCFSCGAAGDIFTAAAFLEGKPLVGRGFLQENLLYLAKELGMDAPDLGQMTEEDIEEMDSYSACFHAAMIVKGSPRSKVVQEKLLYLKWVIAKTNQDHPVLQRIGVGSVTSHENYTERMTKHYKHSSEFLKKIGLDDQEIFNDRALIYVIRDEHGAPVGFTARDLDYEKKKREYDQKSQSIRENTKLTPEVRDAQLDKLFKPRKYKNSSEKLTIFQKSKRLFNIDIAKKYAPPLYVFEGQPSVVTAMIGGLANAVAIGSSYFTREHLDSVLTLGIRHVVFVLDPDAAGQKGTEQFIKLLSEALEGRVGLKVDILTMPAGTEDPDAYIRSFPSLEKGVREFVNLPTHDIFSWNLKKRLQSAVDPLTVAEESLVHIVNEPNYLARMAMTKRLARETSLDEAGLWREVLRQVDIDRMGAEEEKVQIARKVAKDLLQNPNHAQQILDRARMQIETVEKRKSGYDPRKVIDAVHHQFERAEKITKPLELITGFPALDQAFGGVPYCDVFIPFPGKPNHSKSTFLQNLAWHLVENNNDCRVLLHTMDDALSATIPRMMASKCYSMYPDMKVKTDWFRKAGYFRDNIPGFAEAYRETKQWLDNWINEERLITADVSVLAPALASLEVWVRNIRTKFPNDALVVIGDNFAQYDLPGFEGERLDREKSKMVKRLANEYHVTMLMTVELPKAALRPGLRPRMANIKGTSGIAYDANANVGVYNDMKDMREAATLFWMSSEGPGGEAGLAGTKMPIVELVIDKSKISSFDGSIFYRLDPDSGFMEESSEAEQKTFHDQMAAQTSQPKYGSFSSTTPW